LSITDEPVFQIHCVSEETDLFRNGGIEDIARLIIDQNKISTNDVNVIVKGERKKFIDWKNLFLMIFRSICSYNSSGILSKFK
jgi:hypothetical protein